MDWSRTNAALRRSATLWWAWALVMLIACGWGMWFFLGQITLYETSVSARVESRLPPQPIVSAVNGRVVESRLELGNEVVAGQTLLRLDSSELELQKAADKGRLEALDEEVARLGDEMSALASTEKTRNLAANLEHQEALERVHQAELALELAEDEFKRAQEMRGSEILSEQDFVRAQSHAQQNRANALARQNEAAKVKLLSASARIDRRALLERLKRERARLLGERAQRAAELGERQLEIDRRHIRAVRDGRIEAAASVQVGDVVSAGQPLATLVPNSEVHVVGAFRPASALGRVRPGQKALLKLDSLSWIEHGVVELEVTVVGTEARDGVVRIELGVNRKRNELPLTHGMTGTVEIMVEDVSPATMVLRTVGRYLTDDDA